MQMQIGTFRFETPGAEYRELQRRSMRRWARRQRHGRPPELEDMGRDAGQIDLSGSVWVREAADLEALAGLRAEAGLDPESEAEPLDVFLGGGAGSSGQYLGRWTVTRLNETEHALRADGVPVRIDFRVSLLEAAA